MTKTLQERRSVAAEQVDAMLATLSEKKVQKITELFDKTVIQENLDDTNLTEEWEAYHDWLAIRTGSAFHQLSTSGRGKHKVIPSDDTTSEDSKVGADLEDESKSSRESLNSTEAAETEAAGAEIADDSPSGPEQEPEEVDEPAESAVEAKEQSSFFASDDDDVEVLADDVRESPEVRDSEPAANRIGVNDVLQKEFTIEKLRGGYSENDVDDFLDDIAAFLNEAHSTEELDEKITSVENQGFRRKKLGSGCNVQEVDAYLDELVAELKARKN